MSTLPQGDALAWERWVYTFARLRQLPALAQHLPAGAPALGHAAYDLVLNAFLLSPGDHPRLLECVEAWPPHLYSAAALRDSIGER